MRKLTDEKFAALDIAQQIKSAEFKIEWATRELKTLRKAAAKLPKPNPKMVEDISSVLVEEGRYRFRGKKRELQSKLYGYDTSED